MDELDLLLERMERDIDFWGEEWKKYGETIGGNDMMYYCLGIQMGVSMLRDYAQIIQSLREKTGAE